MSRWWRWYLPGFVWIAPLTLVGVAVARIVYKGRSWRLRGCVVECIGGAKWTTDPDTGKRNARSRIWGNPGAQTLGGLVISATSARRADVPLVLHELVHVWQAMICALAGAVIGGAAAGIEGGRIGALWGVVFGGFAGALCFAVAYGAHFVARYAWIRLDLLRERYRLPMAYVPNMGRLDTLRSLLLAIPKVRAIKFYLSPGRIDVVTVGGDLARVEREVRELGWPVRVRARRPWWAAYRWIVFEVQAYDREAKYKRGELPHAWGAE